MKNSLVFVLCLSGVLGCRDSMSEPDSSVTMDAGFGVDGSADAGDDAGVDAGTDVGADAGADEMCEATFVWWQKDAYLDQAGRGAPFWPPHTTTGLVVTCTSDGVETTVADTEMVNHGTSTADMDPDGLQILEAVRAETTTGTRAELTALASAYDACECGNTFLSLDALSDTAVMDLTAELAMYLSANMTCPEEAGGVGQLLADLMMGDIEAVLTLGAMCTFTDGSWEEGLNDALAAVVAVTAEVLADYHVCNNDALIQAELWDGFLTTGTVGSCDTTAAHCAGPAWFLPCTEESRDGCLP